MNRPLVAPARPLPHSLLVVGLTLAAVYSLFPAFSQGHFLSPDETANAAFARQFARTGQLVIREPLNLVVDGVIHPRSIAVSGDRLLPGSFIAFPTLLGLAGKALGVRVIPYLPMVFFLLTLAAFWTIAEAFFGPRSAFLSTVLFAVHPVVAFYTMRGLWHNGLFTSCFVIGIASWVVARRRQSIGWFLLGCLALVLALVLRPSELVWLVIFSAGCLVALELRRRRWLLAGTGLIVVVLTAWLTLQAQTFGQALAVGYDEPASADVAVTPTVNQLTVKLRSLFFPFGVDLVDAVWRFGSFSLTVVGLPTVFGLLGLVGTLRLGQLDRRRWVLAVVSLLALGWLILFYGSFELIETFDREHIVLGSSYLRYWLPGLVMLTLFAGEGIYRLKATLRSAKLVQALVLMAVVFSLQQSLADRFYGLIKGLRSDLATGQVQRQAVLSQVPESAVVYAKTLDKVLYPERRVVGYQELTSQLVDQIPILVEQHVPVYLVSGDSTERQRTDEQLNRRQLTLVRVTALAGEQVLYRVAARAPEHR